MKTDPANRETLTKTVNTMHEKTRITTDREISIMATEYAKLTDPLNQTLEKQADIRMGFIAGFKKALQIHNDVERNEQCEHPYASVLGDGETTAKCLKCGKWL
jgi:hypothetical protein